MILVATILEPVSRDVICSQARLHRLPLALGLGLGLDLGC